MLQKKTQAPTTCMLWSAAHLWAQEGRVRRPAVGGVGVGPKDLRSVKALRAFAWVSAFCRFVSTMSRRRSLSILALIGRVTRWTWAGQGLSCINSSMVRSSSQ